MSDPEKICDYEIHPAASVFPLMEGEQFDGLVASIRKHGVQNPIVHNNGIVLDGRNRIRAVMVLRERGHDVRLPKKQWDEGELTETQWIEAQNLDRRHLSPDAYTLASTALLSVARSEARKRKAASKFDSKKASKAAKARHAVNTKTDSPQKRDTKEMNARSTVGQVAAKAGVSMHKARQAVKLLQAIEAGAVPQKVQADVIAGRLKLRDAVAMVKPKQSAKPRKKKRRPFASIIDDLRLLLGELLACESCDRDQIVDELTVWLKRAKDK